MSQLDVSRRGRVAVLTLKRPERGNRVSQQMAEEITAALVAARRDAAVAACVLTGATTRAPARRLRAAWSSPAPSST
ncbi:MAG: hypothetical protein E6G91_22715 [Alphaproteobacteria bacterium]|nr:MAG: hypothetical protein E6G91_22715 [Alphaproteobacteria bacterium]